ncbi:hypothetical protein F5B22DRAFT_381800 [Xylaria bambusicola]|uniref:uncharacterized protein n=1 Tax=Xylaria bambusicola TaxID=326684 RepID=UPI002007781B|nr:uncharacterized protein F5B22DRAFT_381800 [Xylaria bambusicola]KAI0508734.1 hypothetical protein F5B22DRAFT_381800 [Xylaria bambusicola]
MFQIALPGDRRAGHGIDEVLQVIETLKEAGIRCCCIVGGRALRYYGVPRVPTDWHICVPNDQFAAATAAITELDDKYMQWREILPQLRSLLHTYPHFKLQGVGFCFYIMPASEYFVNDLDESMIERSLNNVPYPQLEVFAQSLITTQRWPELIQVVDGMDLTEEWGIENLNLGEPSPAEAEYVVEKNKKLTGLARLRTKPIDRLEKWKTIVATKKDRIKFHLPKERYDTQFRRKGTTQDPRFKEGRGV